MTLTIEDCCLGLNIENKDEDKALIEKFNTLGLTGKYIDEDEEALYYLDSQELDINDSQVLELIELTNHTALSLEISNGDIFVS